MLRLRELAYGCALGSAGATVAIVFVAKLNFAYRAPALHVALETTAAITASAAAVLLLGRFRRWGFLDELLLSAGLAFVALSNLAFAALPAVFGLRSNRFSIWGSLYMGAFAALLIGLAALLPRRRLGGGPRWPLVVYSATLAVALIGEMLIAVFQHRLPPGVTSSVPKGSARPKLVSDYAVLTAQIYLTALYLMAAFGFTRRHRLTTDELSGWFAVACVFSAAARVNYFFHPAFHSNWVYTGDIFRLGFYLALLVGAAREIASYWRSTIVAASFEERRRLARDVHDGLAQEIAFIGRSARLLQEQTADPQLVERILGAVKRAQEESRRVIGVLDMRGDEPLEQTLAEAAQQAAARYGASLELDIEEGVDLSPHEREALVRIASEAVTNAARHSGAERLRVNLERFGSGARLQVVDDGVGFEHESQGGFGLVTMKDRAEALGGKLKIDSRRGAGTKVELEL